MLATYFCVELCGNNFGNFEYLGNSLGMIENNPWVTKIILQINIHYAEKVAIFSASSN